MPLRLCKGYVNRGIEGAGDVGQVSLLSANVSFGAVRGRGDVDVLMSSLLFLRLLLKQGANLASYLVKLRLKLRLKLRMLQFAGCRIGCP